MLFLYFQLSAAWNLICNDVWYDIADQVFSCGPSSCSFEKRREPASGRVPIIFVSQQNVIEFIAYKPTTPYVIVSANHLDFCAPYIRGTSGGGAALLNDTNLIAWFSTNVAVLHEKLHPIPLGPKVQWHTRSFHEEEESKKILSLVLQNADPAMDFKEIQRTSLVDIHMTVASADHTVCKFLTAEQSRRSAAAHFERFFKHKDSKLDKECEIKLPPDLINSTLDNDHISQITYLQRLRCTKFVPVPEGNGLDTHRFYESLTMGAIPIVIDFDPMRELTEELPVLRVQKWTDVDKEILEQVYIELHNEKRTYNWRRLESDFWIERIIDASVSFIKQ